MEESESAARVALEKAERDAQALKVENFSLRQMFEKSNVDAARAETELKSLDGKFKVGNKNIKSLLLACFLAKSFSFKQNKLVIKLIVTDR